MNRVAIDPISYSDALWTLAIYGHTRCNVCNRNKLICRFADHGNQLAATCNYCRTKRGNDQGRIQANRALVDKARDVPCKDCGQRFPLVCMDFDHLPGHGKSFNVGAGKACYSTKAVAAEIKKCEVVCANCHRIRTHLERVHVRGMGNDQVTVLMRPVRLESLPVIDSQPADPKRSRPARPPKPKPWTHIDTSFVGFVNSRTN